VTAWILHLDHVIRTWIVMHRVPWLDNVMLSVSAVGRGGMGWVAISLALLVRRRIRWQQFARLLAALLMASLIADTFLKPAFGRDRPFLSTPRITVIGQRLADASFPSGHAATSVAGAIIISSFVPRLWPAWLLIACAVGYSRIYLGVHYPLDVAAGAIVGGIIGLLTVAYERHLVHRARNRRINSAARQRS
jgi:undecaprenyl-diphosphatase